MVPKNMNNKQRKTLEHLFSRPAPSGLRWHDFISLSRACGATVQEDRSGSRVNVLLNGVVMGFHKPHPQATLARAAVDSARKFLERAGVTP